jgi:hypothetical protein
MKKAIILVFLTLAILSCEKDKSLLIKDIPDWLRIQISSLEKEIKTDPSTLTSYSAWVRFEWKNDYYFEYIDPPRSYKSLPRCLDGTDLNIADFDNYEKEKCCLEYVWKAPKH